MAVCNPQQAIAPWRSANSTPIRARASARRRDRLVRLLL
jgi:hypothetical protein